MAVSEGGRGRRGSVLLWLLLATTAGWANAAPPHPTGDSPRWSEVTQLDVEFIHKTLSENHPGAIDPQSHAFRNWLERGYREARRRATGADSYAAYYFTLKYFTAGFNDGHLFVDLDGEKLTTQWPGFLLEWRSGERIVVSRAGLEETSLQGGERLISCDGHSPSELGRLLLQPRFGRWQFEGDRARLVPFLLVDQGDPYSKRPQRCRFSGARGPARVTLRWRPIPWAELRPLMRKARQEVEPRIEARWIRPGYFWISLASFASGNEERHRALQAVVTELRQDAPKIRSGEILVFDLRGNSGGASDWGEAIAGALWGESYIRSIAPRASVVDWRASPGNLAHFEQVVLPKFARQFGADSPAYREWKAVADALQRALAHGDAFARENEEVGPRPRNAVRERVSTKVFALTDAGCASACLDFLDLLERIGGVERVGATTSADTLYIDNRNVPLPSALGSLGVSMKVYRDRARGNNQAYVPQHRWSGRMDQTEELEAWIEKLVRGPAEHGIRK
jgi:hypothetical protein